MRLSDFHYELPTELIARYPLPVRSDSRLMCLTKAGVIHQQFRNLTTLIRPNDLLVFNNTKVIPARMFGQKESGGKIEILTERILDDNCLLAKVRASKSPKIDSILIVSETRFRVLGRQDDLYRLQCESLRPVLDIIEEVGQMPLPPYFQRAAEPCDNERYQTIFAKHKGSVAAPTASLHFDHALMNTLKDIETAYLTLHVGAGTFSSVRVENILDHRMHAERIEVSSEVCDKIAATKARGGRVIAVGTTTLRSLESACLEGELKPFHGETDIFIYPGFSFKCVDVLITNFHLPESTLIMLVCAFGSYERVMRAYQIAVENGYRFFSYGDAMWVEKNQG